MKKEKPAVLFFYLVINVGVLVNLEAFEIVAGGQKKPCGECNPERIG
jgi:hypothetical protein